MKRKKLLWLICFLGVSMSISACGGTPEINEVLQSQAEAFGENKEMKDYALLSAEEVLERLIEDFADSYEAPDGTALTEDEADRIRDSVGEDSEQESSDGASGTEAETDPSSEQDDFEDISDRAELKAAMHQMLDDTEEVLNFRCTSGYIPDVDEIMSLYLELEREDAFDVICLGSYSIGGPSDAMVLVFEYDLPVDQLKQMKLETRTLLRQAEGQVNVEGLSDYEIVCAVNEYLCDLITYPESEPYAEETHTPYSAFKNGSAVCDGYSKAAKLMLNDFGIECEFVVGDCPEGGHAWNLVKLDGEWYQLDITWNDAAASWDAEGRKEYLLVTDDYMSQSRVWDTSLYPASAAEKYEG